MDTERLYAQIIAHRWRIDTEAERQQLLVSLLTLAGLGQKSVSEIAEMLNSIFFEVVLQTIEQEKGEK